MASLRLCIFLSLLCANAFCQQFQYTTLQVPGSSSTQALGVNNNGDIVGEFSSGGEVQGFLYSGGTFQTIACPGMSTTAATGINDFGVIVGYCSSSSVQQGFVYQNGTFTYLVYPASTGNWAFGINNQDEIVGQYYTATAPHVHAFIYGNGVFTQIKHLTTANGINRNNKVAGYGCLNGQCTGELFVKGKLNWHLSQQVWFPNGNGGVYGTSLLGINDNGDLVGNIVVPGPYDKGLIYLKSSNSFEEIDITNSDVTTVSGINNSDEVVGYYTVGLASYGFYAQVSP